MHDRTATDSQAIVISGSSPTGDHVLRSPCKRIRIGTGGTLKVTYPNGTVETIPTVLSGQVVEVGAIRIWVTGTSASGMNAEF